MTLTHNTAKVEYDECDELVRVWGLESEDPKDGFHICTEIAKIANGRPIWISVDPFNEKLMKFYLHAGFEMKYMVMVKN